jgi:hypothetical protein
VRLAIAILDVNISDDAVCIVGREKADASALWVVIVPGSTAIAPGRTAPFEAPPLGGPS